MTIRQAIITFDEERIREIDYQAEGKQLAWIVLNALRGKDYPKERGIISIELLHDDEDM